MKDRDQRRIDRLQILPKHCGRFPAESHCSNALAVSNGFSDSDATEVSIATARGAILQSSRRDVFSKGRRNMGSLKTGVFTCTDIDRQQIPRRKRLRRGERETISDEDRTQAIDFTYGTSNGFPFGTRIKICQ